MSQTQSQSFDLLAFDEAFIAAEKQDPNAPIPDGKYVVTTNKIAFKTSKKTHDPMVEVHLRIVGPKYAGRLFFQYFMLNDSMGMSRLKTLLSFLDPNLVKLSELQDEERLKGLLDIALNVRASSYTSNKDGRTYQNLYVDGPATAEQVAAVQTGTEGPNVHDDIPF